MKVVKEINVNGMGSHEVKKWTIIEMIIQLEGIELT